jgi:hypothetical protein
MIKKVDLYKESYLCEYNGYICKVDVVERSDKANCLYILRIDPGYFRKGDTEYAAWISQDDFDKQYKILDTFGGPGQCPRRWKES